jgi:hypothetical protein
METVERFNRSELRFIIDNKERVKTQLDRYTDDKDVDGLFTLLNTYINKSNPSGYIKVSYNQIDKSGRFYAYRSLSLQNMCREIRGSIAGNYYFDLDMVNCHPVILCKLFDLPYLSKYIDNRDKIINKLIKLNDYDYDYIKTAILQTIYGGNNKNIKPSKWFKGFKIEIKNLLDKMPSLYPDIYKKVVKSKGKNYFNLNGSVLSLAIQIVENDLLQIIIKSLQKKKTLSNEMVLCFDGIMIPKTNTDLTILNDILIPYIEKKIFKLTEIPIKLKIKEFQTLNLNDIRDSLNNENESDSDSDSDSDSSEGSLLPLIEIEENIPLGDYDIRSNFYWIDFIEALTLKSRNEHFNKNELILYIKENLHKVMVYVIDIQRFISKLSLDNMFNWGKNPPIDWFIYWEEHKDRTGKISYLKKSINLFGLFKSEGMSNFIKSYNTLTFIPKYSETEKRIFNTWSGFKATKIDKDKINMDIIEPILNHMKVVIANNDPEIYTYLMSWFKHLFTKPEVKSKVAVILYSKEQQIGKGMFVHFIMNKIFGARHSVQVSGLDHLTKDFNNHLKDKLLINSDELSSLTGTNYHAIFDKLKNVITEPTMIIEPKGVDAVVYPDYSNIICCTNHKFTIKVEEGDRRYFITECNPVYENDTKYFDNLLTLMTQEAGDHFFSYVINFEGVNIRKILSTKLKTEMMKNSLSTSIRFIKLVKEIMDSEEGDFEEYTWQYNLRDNEDWIKTSLLYSFYKKYCDEEHEKCVSNRVFGQQIQDIIQKKKSGCLKYGLKTIL